MNNTDRSIHKIVILVILNSNQHENKWICEAETSDEVYICKIHSGLDNKFPHFTWYGKSPIIREIRHFVCEVYPITSPDKKLY